jgi:S-adenosylmethionine synthetase
VKRDFVFTSESVTEGHPDKLCDQISDTILDHFLRQDPFARVYTECAVASGVVFVAAQFASEATVDIPAAAREVIALVGYDRDDFNSKTCSIMTSLAAMPPENSPRIDEATLDDAAIERIPATHQATLFGFACTQTPALIPLPIWLAHKLARRLAAVRLTRQLPYLAPDGKTQVSVEFEDGRPHRIHGIALTAATYPELMPATGRFEADMRSAVIEAAFRDEPVLPDDATRVFINLGGPFHVGGPARHSGLTGRKTAVDTYGEYCRHSGAALSGKDPSRIDRVGAYAARYAAKNVVRAGLAAECELQLTYAIGLSRPVSVQVETFGTGTMPDADIAKLVERNFDFRPAAIVRQFNLRRQPALSRKGFYSRLAAYGHVGRMDIGLPWELTDKVGALRA